ncbi:MAG: hypothetical protein Unbinned6284contig1001_19 [Prokaryotic dsDNA virus sp.]|nr:MAG: hypothetical protein Unbinned6284contig1001_19 [Prokaryotic dsDNA virus sp.]|tara:strand:- start:1184 stop:1714 length:531 start_codon:yes stop_codon:yes gene_type:complete
MNPQQLHDYIIKPTLEYMSGNYNSIEARFLLLCTAAIESDCGYYIKQVNGPALGIWQMELETENDIHEHSDALQRIEFTRLIDNLTVKSCRYFDDDDLINSPMYACAMARLKYSMTPEPLPEYAGDPNIDLRAFYDYYAKFYHGVDKDGKELGKSTYTKWATAIARLDILNVDLGE